METPFKLWNATPNYIFKCSQSLRFISRFRPIQNIWPILSVTSLHTPSVAFHWQIQASIAVWLTMYSIFWILYALPTFMTLTYLLNFLLFKRNNIFIYSRHYSKFLQPAIRIWRQLFNSQHSQAQVLQPLVDTTFFIYIIHAFRNVQYFLQFLAHWNEWMNVKKK